MRGRSAYREDGVKVQISTQQAVLDLLPTPNASLSNYEEEPETWEVRRQAAAEKHGNNGLGAPLPIALKQSIGATTSQPSGAGKPSPALRLSPWFVEWMMGVPAGWSDPDCPLSATEFKSRSASSSGNTSWG
jgi:hypothetical protein